VKTDDIAGTGRQRGGTVTSWYYQTKNISVPWR